MKPLGLSERRALQVIGMSASALRYQPAPDRNGELREIPVEDVAAGVLVGRFT